MSKRGQDIIAVIDQRIDSYIKESKITVRYIGQIIEVLGNNRYKVQLMGYDTVYTFPARPYVDAIVNDYVYIESKAGNIFYLDAFFQKIKFCFMERNICIHILIIGHVFALKTICRCKGSG